MVGPSDRSATPADGICVGTIIAAWGQLDIDICGRRLVRPQRYMYLPAVGHSALKSAVVIVKIAPPPSDSGSVYMRLIANANVDTYHACNATGHPHLPQRVHVL